MNQEIKKEWVEALRSGKYQQATGVLCNGVGYCCLGVLCDIVKDKVGGEWVKDGNEYRFDIGDMSYLSLLPPAVQKYTELPNCLPSVPGKDEMTLSGLNDTGSTFINIADIIEEKL